MDAMELVFPTSQRLRRGWVIDEKRQDVGWRIAQHIVGSTCRDGWSCHYQTERKLGSCLPKGWALVEGGSAWLRRAASTSRLQPSPLIAPVSLAASGSCLNEFAPNWPLPICRQNKGPLSLGSASPAHPLHLSHAEVLVAKLRICGGGGLMLLHGPQGPKQSGRSPAGERGFWVSQLPVSQLLGDVGGMGCHDQEHSF